jgi:hypothetical protein
MSAFPKASMSGSDRLKKIFFVQVCTIKRRDHSERGETSQYGIERSAAAKRHWQLTIDNQQLEIAARRPWQRFSSDLGIQFAIAKRL